MQKLSKPELLEKCCECGITKCKSKTKSQLIELIENKTKNEECKYETIDTNTNNNFEKNIK
jgi:hypothetical protein